MIAEIPFERGNDFLPLVRLDLLGQPAYREANNIPMMEFRSEVLLGAESEPDVVQPVYVLGP